MSQGFVIGCHSWFCCFLGFCLFCTFGHTKKGRCEGMMSFPWLEPADFLGAAPRKASPEYPQKLGLWIVVIFFNIFGFKKYFLGFLAHLFLHWLCEHDRITLKSTPFKSPPQNHIERLKSRTKSSTQATSMNGLAGLRNSCWASRTRRPSTGPMFAKWFRCFWATKSSDTWMLRGSAEGYCFWAVGTTE